MTPNMPTDPDRPRFREDCHAAVAIEFAFVAPLLITMFVGGFALSRGYFALQKIDFIAHNLAELTARITDCGDSSLNACLTAGNVKDIFDAGNVLLSPLPRENLKVTLSEVGVLQGAGARKVETSWSIAKGGAQERPCNTAPVLPAGFTAATAPLGAIIIADVTYRFSPGPGFEAYSWTFTRSNYAVARNLTPAAAGSNLPNGHIRNQSGEGTTCKIEP